MSSMGRSFDHFAPMQTSFIRICNFFPSLSILKIFYFEPKNTLKLLFNFCNFEHLILVKSIALKGLR